MEPGRSYGLWCITVDLGQAGIVKEKASADGPRSDLPCPVSPHPRLLLLLFIQMLSYYAERSGALDRSEQTGQPTSHLSRSIS